MEINGQTVNEQVKYADLGLSPELMRAIDKKDIVGELIDLELNKIGISTLKITPDMVMEKNGVARGHYMFAMADTLALAVVDAHTALTGVANVKYKLPVYSGANLVAKAEVTNRRDDKYFICVTHVFSLFCFQLKFYHSHPEQNPIFLS